MKAAQLYQFDELLSGSELLVYEEVSEPVIEKPTDVIVRIGGAGVCGTDLELIKGVWCNQMRIELPMILGHENAGWVEEIGFSVESVKVGDPVIIHPLGGTDFAGSDRGTGRRADERNFYPGFNRHGGFAEYMLTKERMLVRLPSHLSPMDIAPLADAGLTAYSAARKASEHLVPGHCTLVLGAGGLGHVGIQVLRALSAAEIIAVDKSEAALDLARQAGAHYTFIADEQYTGKILALTEGRGGRCGHRLRGEERYGGAWIVDHQAGRVLLSGRLRRGAVDFHSGAGSVPKDHRGHPGRHSGGAARTDHDGGSRPGDVDNPGVLLERSEPGASAPY